MSVCNDGTDTTMLVQPAYGGMGGYGGMGMWNQEWIWLIVILAVVWGGNGFSGNDKSGGSTIVYDTGASMQRGFDTQTIIGKLDGISNGVCSLGYDQLNQMNGINTNIAALGTQLSNAICTLGYNEAQLANATQMQIANNFAGLSTDLCQLGNNIAQQFNASTVAQLQGQNALSREIADCCCTSRYENLQNSNAVQSAIAQTNYNLATQSCDTRNTINGATRDIIDSQNSGVRAILDKLTSQELAAKDAQIAAQNQQIFSLQLKASQEAQNAYLVDQLGQKCPQPAYWVTAPTPVNACGIQNLANSYANGNYSPCGCNG